MTARPQAEPMMLRPHHLLDIVTSYTPDEDPGYLPAPGENGVRTISRLVGRTLDVMATFVIGPDAICEPCSHLGADGRCDRILQHHNPPQATVAPLAMDDYNDPLDARVLEYLGLEPGVTMSLRSFLEHVNARVPGIEAVCTHPGQEQSARLAGLKAGLKALGIRA